MTAFGKMWQVFVQPFVCGKFTPEGTPLFVAKVDCFILALCVYLVSVVRTLRGLYFAEFTGRWNAPLGTS